MQPLTQVPKGKSGKIIAIAGLSQRDRQRLYDLGLMPNSRLMVVQTTPLFIVRVFDTEIAIDRLTAAAILLGTD